MGRIYRVKPAAPGGPKELRLALQEAAQTGVLELPNEALSLTVDSNVKVEVAPNVKN